MVYKLTTNLKDIQYIIRKLCIFLYILLLLIILAFLVQFFYFSLGLDKVDIYPSVKRFPFYVSQSCTNKGILLQKYGLEKLKKYPYRPVDCGEDAIAFYHDHKAAISILAVADGVGGWAREGIDSSKFSWGLINGTLAAYKDHPQDPSRMNPKDLLNRAHLNLINLKEMTFGSCTICVGVLNHLTLTLSVINVGDSGFLIYRNKNIFFRSKEQQYSFNFPYQLSPNLSVTSEDGEVFTFALQDNDIVLFATDGLFDNLYDSDIATHLKLYLDVIDQISHSRPDYRALVQKQLCQTTLTLKEHAIRLSEDQGYLSPFAIHAKQQGALQQGLGGKVDDTTILILHARA